MCYYMRISFCSKNIVVSSRLLTPTPPPIPTKSILFPNINLSLTIPDLPLTNLTNLSLPLPRAMPPTKKALFVRKKQQPEEVPVYTDLPPDVHGQVRCYLTLKLDRFTWAGPKLLNELHAVVKWWGEHSQGAVFKCGKLPALARYPIKCGPKQFASYVADMGTLQIDFIDSKSYRIKGDARIPISKLTKSMSLTRDLDITLPSNPERLLGRVNVSLSIVAAPKPQPEDPTLDSSSLLKVSPAKQHPRKSPTTRRAVSPQKSYPPTDKENIFPSRSLHNRGQVTDLISEVLAKSRRLKSDIVKCQMNSSEVEIDQITEYLRESVDKLPASQVREIEEEGEGAADNTLDLLFGKDKIDSVLKKHGLDVSSCSSSSSLPDESLIEHLFYKRGGVESPVSSDSEAEEVVTKQRSPEKARYQEQHHHDMRAYSPVPLLAEQPLSLNRLTALGRVNKCKVHIENLQFDTTAASGTYFLEYSIPLGSDSECRTITSRFNGINHVAMPPTKKALFVRKKQQPEEVPVYTDLPPDVHGQVRCYLTLKLDRFTWAGPKLLNELHAVVKWWGEHSQGAVFKCGKLPALARYPIKCGPKQFASYVADMGTLQIDFIDSKSYRIKGDARIPISKLTKSMSLTRDLDITLPSNPERLLGRVNVSLSIVAAPKPQPEDPTLDSSSLLKVSPAKQYPRKSPTTRRAVSPQKSYPPTDKENIFPSRSLHNRGQVTDLISEVLAKSRRLKSDIVKCQMNSSEVEIDQITEYLRESVDKLPASQVREIEEEGEGAADNTLDLLFGKDKIDSVLKKHGLDVSSCSSSSSLPDESLIEHLFYKRGGVESPVSSDSEAEEVVTKQRSPEKARYQEQHHHDMRAYSPVPLLAEQPLSLNRLTALGRVNKCKVHIENLQFDTTAASGTYFLEYSIPLGSDSECRTITSRKVSGPSVSLAHTNVFPVMFDEVLIRQWGERDVQLSIYYKERLEDSPGVIAESSVKLDSVLRADKFHLQFSSQMRCTKTDDYLGLVCGSVTLNSGAMVDLPGPVPPVQQEPLAILVSVGSGKALQGAEKGTPVNSYIVVRMIDSVDRLTSEVVWNSHHPTYNIRHMIPFTHTTAFVERLRDNFIILEVWNKIGKEDKLLGLTKLPTSQLYLSLSHMATSTAVIAVDGYMPIVNPLSSERCGILQCVLATGSHGQLNELMANKNIVSRDVVPVSRDHVVEEEGEEERPRIRHTLDITINSLSDAVVFEASADTDCYVTFTLPTDSTNRTFTSPICPSAPHLKFNYNTSASMILPDTTSLLQHLSRHLTDNAVVFEVWRRVYYPNIRDISCARGVLPLQQLSHLVSLTKGVSEVIAIPVTSTQHEVEGGYKAGTLSVTVGYTSETAAELSTKPENFVQLCVTVGRCCGLQYAARQALSSGAPLHHEATTGLNSYTTVELSFAGIERETGVRARSFTPNYGSHFSLTLPTVMAQSHSGPPTLAENLSKGHLIVCVFHKETTSNKKGGDILKSYRIKGDARVPISKLTKSMSLTRDLDITQPSNPERLLGRVNVSLSIVAAPKPQPEDPTLDSSSLLKVSPAKQHPRKSPTTRRAVSPQKSFPPTDKENIFPSRSLHNRGQVTDLISEVLAKSRRLKSDIVKCQMNSSEVEIDQITEYLRESVDKLPASQVREIEEEGEGAADNTLDLLFGKDKIDSVLKKHGLDVSSCSSSSSLPDESLIEHLFYKRGGVESPVSSDSEVEEVVTKQRSPEKARYQQQHHEMRAFSPVPLLTEQPLSLNRLTALGRVNKCKVHIENLQFDTTAASGTYFLEYSIPLGSDSECRTITSRKVSGPSVSLAHTNVFPVMFDEVLIRQWGERDVQLSIYYKERLEDSPSVIAESSVKLDSVLRADKFHLQFSSQMRCTKTDDYLGLVCGSVTLNSGAMVDLPGPTPPAKQEPLAILVSVGSGKALQGAEKGTPVNSYIVVRMIDSVDRLTSEVVWNSHHPTYNVRHMIPFTHTTAFVERLRDNFIILEVWNKIGKEDKLLGLTKLPTSQLYLSLSHMATSTAVIAVDGYMPIVNPLSSERCGILQCVLAAGSHGQLNELMANKNIVSRDVVPVSRDHVVEEEGEEERPRIRHTLDITINSLSDAVVFEASADTDCYVTFTLPTDSTNRTFTSPICPSAPNLKFNYNTSASMILPDTTSLLQHLSRHLTDNAVVFEVWRRVYYPNIRDISCARGVLPLQQLSHLVSLTKGVSEVIAIPVTSTQHEVEGGYKAGTLSVTVGYTSETAEEVTNKPENFVQLCVTVGRCCGLQYAARQALASGAPLHHAATTGLNSYTTVELSFAGIERETGVRARSFTPNYGSHFSLTLPTVMAQSHSGPPTLAENLSKGHLIVCVFHKETTSNKKGGDILLCRAHVPLSALLTKHTGIHSWVPLFSPTVRDKDAVSALELEVNFGEVTERELVMEDASRRGWLPPPLPKVTTEYLTLTLGVDKVWIGEDVLMRYKSAQDVVYEDRHCYLRIKFYNSEAVCSDLIRFSDISKDGKSYSDTTFSVTLPFTVTPSLLWCMREEPLEIQVWLLPRGDTSGDTVGDTILGCGYVNISSLLFSNHFPVSSAEVVPLVKANCASLGGAGLYVTTTLTTLDQLPEEEREITVLSELPDVEVLLLLHHLLHPLNHLLLTRDMKLPYPLFLSTSNTLSLVVWGCGVGDEGEVIGTATVDLAPLFLGFPSIEGWYLIQDVYSKDTFGQVKVAFTPLEVVNKERIRDLANCPTSTSTPDVPETTNFLHRKVQPTASVAIQRDNQPQQQCDIRSVFQSLNQVEGMIRSIGQKETLGDTGEENIGQKETLGDTREEKPPVEEVVEKLVVSHGEIIPSTEESLSEDDVCPMLDTFDITVDTECLSETVSDIASLLENVARQTQHIDQLLNSTEIVLTGDDLDVDDIGNIDEGANGDIYKGAVTVGVDEGVGCNEDTILAEIAGPTMQECAIQCPSTESIGKQEQNQEQSHGQQLKRKEQLEQKKQLEQPSVASSSGTHSSTTTSSSTATTSSSTTTSSGSTTTPTSSGSTTTTSFGTTTTSSGSTSTSSKPSSSGSTVTGVKPSQPSLSQPTVPPPSVSAASVPIAPPASVPPITSAPSASVPVEPAASVPSEPVVPPQYLPGERPLSRISGRPAPVTPDFFSAARELSSTLTSIRRQPTLSGEAG
eukprot:sb/3460366/